MNNIPIRQHPNCNNDDCPTCFDDHEKLGNYFENLIGVSGVDWLHRYRIWLDKNNIPAEINGWASQEAFLEKNILTFIKTYNDE